MKQFCQYFMEIMHANLFLCIMFIGEKHGSEGKRKQFRNASAEY